MKLVVIGGVAGGATAAARARRLDEHAKIVVFERGEHISFANCGLPYYIGGVIKNRDDLLVTTADDFSKRYCIDVRSLSEAVAINRKEKTVVIKNVMTGETYAEPYDRLILSPGAEPIRPPIKGIDNELIFHLRNIPDTDRIKNHVDTHHPKSAVIAGGGFIGLEMAENLVLRGVATTIVEKQEQVMASLDYEMAGLVHAHLAEHGVTCVLGEAISAFEKKGESLVVKTDNGNVFDCDMVVMSVGVKPERRLAREAGLEIGDLGGISVNAAMQTSDPDIYAIGDAVEVFDVITGAATRTPLAGPANKQGRIAADNAMGRRSLFRGTIGTAIVKIFDLTVASTGANEKGLVAREIDFMTSHTHSGSHASYYPGAEIMSVKLLFSPSDGKILGTQIVGFHGVDKRIDVLATAISGNMTVYDLETLELAYAPPYSSAKDPVNISGFVAANRLKGDSEAISWNEMAALDPACDVLIDLRNKDELDESGRIDGAVHIPLDELRSRLSELDKNKRYILFCAVGLRGYIGCRILSQHGFDARNLSGGFKTWLGASEKIMAESCDTPLWRAE
ncbi:MAG: FAD-dependent oxidoreductase [Deltaproteobacteria bacterium]|nr:FAD-dependent oxidoreductase [Deltaproteobacteria bacterium]